MERREKEAGCSPAVSPAIFQAVFLQDNGFNRDLIKIIQMARPAVNSIWEFPRHRELFHDRLARLGAIYEASTNLAPIRSVIF